MIAILFSFLTLAVVIIALIIIVADSHARQGFWNNHTYCPRCNAVKDNRTNRFVKLPEFCK